MGATVVVLPGPPWAPTITGAQNRPLSVFGDSGHDPRCNARRNTPGGRMTHSHDVVIVGAGIGGSALARALAADGLDVLVLEQCEIYEDRVRGEAMVPWGVVE